jgi:hypothetical protein
MSVRRRGGTRPEPLGHSGVGGEEEEEEGEREKETEKAWTVGSRDSGTSGI